MECYSNPPVIEDCSGVKERRESEEESSSLLPNKNHSSRDNYGGFESSLTYTDSYLNRDFPTSVSESPCSEEVLKRRLKYFFMNPLEKWKAKGKFPWKLILQVVKMLFVTLLLCVFGSDGYMFELQKQNTVTTFRHIFIPDWTAIRDVASYPPSTGPYAVYTKSDFYSNIDHVIKKYSNITNIALGTYCYDGPNCSMTGVSFCRNEFMMMVSFNNTVTFDSRIKTICHNISNLYPEGDDRWLSFSIEEYLSENNDSVAFDRLISANVKFHLSTIFLKSLGNNKYPDCYKFKVIIDYDNNEHDGQMLVTLETKARKIKCDRTGYLFNDRWGYYGRQVLNMFIISICVLSLLLCIRCLCKARILCKETDKFFKCSQNKPLSTQEKMEFVDMWYWMMIINDIFIIIGCILKIKIEQRTVEGDQYATCAILLGSGTLLVYSGVLRYLGFFSKYNILILTLKRAIPNVLRFTLCCILLYAGFCICGWVVLGPYHIKFRNLSTTSECLFAMMNGDDLFATFAITNTDSDLIWWFSRIYLYIFISMFIYVVISLFISVIMDSYETVKDYYRNGCTLTRIQLFIADYPDDYCSSFYQQRRHAQKSIWQRLRSALRMRNNV